MRLEHFQHVRDINQVNRLGIERRRQLLQGTLPLLGVLLVPPALPHRVQEFVNNLAPCALLVGLLPCRIFDGLRVFAGSDIISRGLRGFSRSLER